MICSCCNERKFVLSSPPFTKAALLNPFIFYSCMISWYDLRLHFKVPTGLIIILLIADS